MNVVKNVYRALEWVDKYSTSQYVLVSSSLAEPYNEVTGYFIPTLIEYGMKDKARSFSKYLASQQKMDGSWSPHKQTDSYLPYIFDVAQIIEGLSCFDTLYESNISLALKWINNHIVKGQFVDAYKGAVPDHIYPRVLYPLKKCGYDITALGNYKRDYPFDCLSHFYGYAFEGAARLKWNVDCYVNELKRYGGVLPEKPSMNSYCYTGISQCAVSLFLCDEYDLGMKALEFVTNAQRDSGGFLGSNGIYFNKEEISWAVKFYLDAISEAQKCWFRKNFHIFSDKLENGLNDKRFRFIQDNIKPNDKVLDVGSGKGRYINNLVCDRYACDILDTSKYLDAKFSVGSALNLPYKDKTFDVVFCCESLEHSVLPYEAIKECLRVVKDGGRLLVVDKSNKVKCDGLLFCEQWLDFDHIRNAFGAEIFDLNQSNTYAPFLGARIIK